MNDITVKQSLGEFLRATRERLTPEQVGLPPLGRRCTPGLRREEVAQLANIGVSWYTSIEQGKNVRPSHQVLESLASALKLSEDERRYIFMLSKFDEIEEVEIDKEISLGLERTVYALEPHPAYVIGKYWDVLLWNRAAEAVFRFPTYSSSSIPRPNMLHRFLMDPFMKEISSDWEEHVKIAIANFRSDCARYAQDAKLQEMIERYKRESELFNSCWSSYEVKTINECHKRWNDPLLGNLEFEHVNLQVSNYPELKLMIYTASPSTVEKLKQRL